MKVADIVDLRQRKKIVPCQREGILNQSTDLELPSLEMHLRLFAQIQYWPVPDLVLTDRQLGHAVSIRWSPTFRRLAAKSNVHGALV